MSRKKITIIGAGNVGSTASQRLIEKEIGDVVLVDIIEDMPQGKALDIRQAGPIYGYDSRIIGVNDYEETKDSDIIIVTSGRPRTPGMSRDDLLKINAKIVKSVVENAVQKSPNAILIMVSNPLDAMTYLAYKVSKFPPQRVIGMAGVLDSARLATFISMELDVSIENIHAFVLGGHGDTMVPSKRYTTVAGIPILELMPKERLDEIIERTRNGGLEIVQLVKTGSAFYAPSAAIVDMVEAIVKDKKKILPCASLCQGEYGIHDLFVGVPVKLGARGVEKIIEIRLDEDESKAFKRSVDAVKELCKEIDKLL